MPTNQLAPPDLPGLFMRSIGVPNALGPPDLQRPSMQNTPPLAAPPPTDGTMTPADVYNFNAANLGDAWTAAQDAATWREAAQNYGQGMLMGSVGPGGKVAPAEAMWDAFDAAHAASGLDKFSRMNLFQHGPSDLEISHVQVDPAMRGQGVGNQLMDMLTNKADEHGVTLHASPASDADPETGLDYGGLREWYQRWGFDPSGSGDRLTRSPAAAAQQQPTPGFTAYHGSPHMFDQFDLSKIGTGEGAQAYGHGMYLADSEGVARSYRDALAPPPIPQPHPELQAAQDAYHAEVSKGLPVGGTDAEFQAAMEARQKAYDNLMEKNKLPPIAGSSPGHMYEVNVNADPAKFLDWDAPLSEQHPDVQAALRQVEPYRLRDDMSFAGFPSSRSPTGAEYVKDLAGMPPEDISVALQKAGIPGIRYLDQGSRNAGGWHLTPPNETVSGKWMVKSNDYNSQGMHFDNEAEARAALADKIGSQTRNSVVFDAATMNIIRRYGLAGLLGGGAAAAATQQQGQQQ